MKTALEQPAKNDLSTMFLEFLQVHGPNVHEVSVDAFDCALLPLQNAFDFQISPESLYTDPIYVESLHNFPATF